MVLVAGRHRPWIVSRSKHPPTETLLGKTLLKKDLRSTSSTREARIDPECLGWVPGAPGFICFESGAVSSKDDREGNVFPLRALHRVAWRGASGPSNFNILALLLLTRCSLSSAAPASLAAAILSQYSLCCPVPSNNLAGNPSGTPDARRGCSHRRCREIAEELHCVS